MFHLASRSLERDREGRVMVIGLGFIVAVLIIVVIVFSRRKD